MTKSERIEIGIEKWRINKGLGGLKWPTGFGKTTGALNIVKNMVNKNPELRVLILVHSTTLKDQWSDKIEELGLSKHCKVRTIQKIQMMQKRIQRTYSFHLLIIDEVDEFYSQDRSNSWNSNWIRYKYCLWLSATPETKDNRHLEMFKILPIVDEITRDEALHNKWIEEFREFNLAVPFTTKEKDAYIKYSEEITNLLAKFQSNFAIAAKCLGYIEKGKHIAAYTASTHWARQMGWSSDIELITKSPKQPFVKQETYDTYIAINETWHPSKILGYAARLMKYTKERKKLCYYATNKLKVVESIIENQNKKTIVFNEATEVCDNLYSKLKESYNVGIYHSNIKSQAMYKNADNEATLKNTGEFVLTRNTSKSFNVPKMYSTKWINKMNLEAFANNELSVLIAGKGLDKGLDIPDITLAIIASYNSTLTQYIQRLGRITRINIDKPEPVIVVNLYVPDTIEHSTLRYNNKGYWIDSYKEIKLDYTPPFSLLF